MSDPKQNPLPITRADLTGLVLAGGVGQRVGGRDKGLIELAGRPLIAWSIAALTPQVGTLLISANRNLDIYRQFGYSVLTDADSQTFPAIPSQGPLAGILAGLLAAPSPWLITLPCDAPNPPADLATRLIAALQADAADLAVATAGGQTHWLHALIPRRLATNLQSFLANGERRAGAWLKCQRLAVANFNDHPEGFINLNTESERLVLEQHLIAQQS